MSYKDWFPRGSGDWFDQRGSNDRSQPPKFKLPISKPVLIALVIVALIIVVVQGSAGFLTEIYWFQAQKLSSVFWTTLISQWGLWLTATILSTVIFLISFRLAQRRAGSISLPDELAQLIPLRSPKAALLVIAASIILGVITGNGVRGQWEVVLRFIHATSFGVTDPIFGHDVGLYVFGLPFYHMLHAWLMQLLFLCLVGSAAIYVLTLLPKFQLERRIIVPTPIRGHLLSLAALLALNWSFGYWLERFNLLYSTRGVAFGASYTDIHADLLALNVMTVLSAMVAVLLLLGIAKKTWKYSAFVIGALFVSNILLRGVYPGLIQKYVVVPNELVKETPYIEHNITATVEAYGLKDLSILKVEPDKTITQADLEDDTETLTNIRLWEYSPLLRSYKQLQEIRSYYDFLNADIDRYSVRGHTRQVMIAARELNLRELQNPTWTNTKLEFTHGYGVVMNPVNEVSPSGQPVFWVKDLPPLMSIPMSINKPQIYYGEAPENYAFVKTTVQEFDYPMGESNARTTYDGSGGVPMGSLWRRLIYALSFNDSKIIFSDVFTPESRIMYHRNIRGRLRKAAPFLLYDGDPYMAVVNGRLLWIQDCYTATDGYPYSEPVPVGAGRSRARINYIRNSVKATVDAYDGTMIFYVLDNSDPLIATWRKIFPDLFTDGSSMSPELRRHIRYPKGLFAIQSEIYRTYHMQNPNTFYNKEDVWETVGSGDDHTAMDSYYLIMTLAGETSSEFVIISPFMPVGKNNMIAWLAGRSDGEHYGDLLVYKFPKQKLIYGPTQVAALVDQNPEISAQLSLWSQRGSDVIRGNMLVIPIGKSLLYVQPLYLRAERGDLPELKRVIVSTGGRVTWAQDFGSALAKLLGLSATAASPEDFVDQPRTIETSTNGGSHDLHSLAVRAQEIWEASQSALRAGDWKGYGHWMNKLEEVILEMERKSSSR
ncbi:MAG: hypothetical protein CSA35_02565 [Dethiosulfovibrio peptidovorans]|nr:MAG: hypothetical protein CSA35_02565 [Dethiosulfovibrio peptidovorans]